MDTDFRISRCERALFQADHSGDWHSASEHRLEADATAANIRWDSGHYSLCYCAHCACVSPSTSFMSTVSSSIAPDVDPAVLHDVEASSLYNVDLAPVPRERRKWKTGSFAALWIS